MYEDMEISHKNIYLYKIRLAFKFNKKTFFTHPIKKQIKR